MRIHNEHVTRIDEDRGVGIDQRLRAGTSEENARGDFLDIEELRIRACSHGPEPRGTVVCKLQKTGARKSALYESREKIAPRVDVWVRVRMRVIVCSMRSVHLGVSL